MSLLPDLGRSGRLQTIADRIFQLVQEYDRVCTEERAPFVPGEGEVRYGGRQFDAAERVNLVDTALEFNLTAGRYAERLERALAEWYGVRCARLVNSGSSANLIAFSALTSEEWGDRRIQPGDEVITVACGFPTTVTPILQYGAVPVFVDVALPTCNIDVAQLERAISEKTKAVMIAHTLGNPFDLDAVVQFCKARDLWLVEDNCDAAGSLYLGKKTGSFGDLATLSFYPPHHMTLGEGGAVLCHSPKMARILESFRDWGRDCWCVSGCDNTCGKRFQWKLGELPSGYDHKYSFSHLGYNAKVTDMQAAVGLAQLEKLNRFNKARRDNWQFFAHALRSLGDFFVLPQPTVQSDPSWFGFMLVVREGAPFTRDQIVAYLEQRKIQTRMLFAGNLVRQPALVTLRQQCEAKGRKTPFRVAHTLEVTDQIMKNGFWFGVYHGLTHPMREYIVETIFNFVGNNN